MVPWCLGFQGPQSFSAMQPLECTRALRSRCGNEVGIAHG